MNNQTFNLNKMRLAPMTETEMQEVNGGGLGLGSLTASLQNVVQRVANAGNGLLDSVNGATGLITTLNGILFSH